MNVGRWLVIAAIVLLPVLATGQGQGGEKREIQCPQDYLDKEAMNRIVTAQSATEMEREWRRVAAPDALVKLVFAVRRSQLLPGKESDDLLIAAVPADTVTFDLLYSLCYPRLEDVSEELAEIAGGSWLELALEAVLRQKHGYRKILMLPLVGHHNADIGEVIPCLISELKDRAPAAYRRTLKQLPKPASGLVCPDCC